MNTVFVDCAGAQPEDLIPEFPENVLLVPVKNLIPPPKAMVFPHLWGKHLCGYISINGATCTGY